MARCRHAAAPAARHERRGLRLDHERGAREARPGRELAAPVGSRGRKAQLERLAQRPTLGIARLGAGGEHFSGDLFIAFSTANRGLPRNDYGDADALTVGVTMLSNTYVTELFDVVADATEEAVLNALLGAVTTTGRDSITAHALTAELLEDALARGSR